MIYIHAMLYFVNISHGYLCHQNGCHRVFCALSDPPIQTVGRVKSDLTRLGESLQKERKNIEQNGLIIQVMFTCKEI